MYGHLSQIYWPPLLYSLLHISICKTITSELIQCCLRVSVSRTAHLLSDNQLGLIPGEDLSPHRSAVISYL